MIIVTVIWRHWKRASSRTGFLEIFLVLCSVVVFPLAKAGSLDTRVRVMAFPIDHYGFAYEQASNPVLHIISDGKDYLWDPSDLRLTTWEGDNDRLPKLDIALQPPEFGDTPLPSQSGDNSVIPLAGRIWPDGEKIIHYYNPSKTRLSWDDYFVFSNKSGLEQKFFIVVAEKKGAYIANRFAYHGDESTMSTIEQLPQDLGPGTIAGAIQLTSDKILILIPQNKVFPCRKSCTYAVTFSILSERVLSIEGQIFVIPYAAMSAALTNAGPELRARYDAVRQLTQSATPVPIAAVGALVLSTNRVVR